LNVIKNSFYALLSFELIHVFLCPKKASCQEKSINVKRETLIFDKKQSKNNKGRKQMNFIDVTEENFDDIVLNSEKAVLVDFWAPWCGPCKMMLPVLEEVSKHFSDRLLVVKLNVDSAQKIATRYNVSSIPTLIIFNKKKVLDSKIGVSSTQHIIEWVEKLVA
jgi:thioredoxin 1